MDLRDTRPYYVVHTKGDCKIYRCSKDFDFLTKEGIPHSVYKCYTIEEAKACKRGNNPSDKDARYIFDDTNNYPYAFIDGSFNHAKKVYGWGGFIDYCGTRYMVKGNGDNPEYAKYKSTIGEALGVMNVVDKAVELGITHLVIYFDFAPLETWLFEGCKSENEVRKIYKDHIENAVSDGLHLIFKKVEAHTKVGGNCIADMIAKDAVGAKRKKKSLPFSFFNVRNTEREYAFMRV